jgi:hypothetical protein
MRPPKEAHILLLLTKKAKVEMVEVLEIPLLPYGEKRDTLF